VDHVDHPTSEELMLHLHRVGLQLHYET
jgi:hypothetical protein